MLGIRRTVVVTTMIATLTAGMGIWLQESGTPPQTLAGIENEMDRPFLAYDIWDETPVVVFQVHEGGEYIFIDRLQLDRMNMGVPFFPSWQWTGFWSYIQSSSDPASIAFDRGPWGTALFGQINDPAIVAVEVITGAETNVYPVSMPGILIELNDDDAEPDVYRFLDANGMVIWTSTGSEVGP